MTYVYAFISTLMAAFMQFFITYSLAMMAFWILEISTIVFIVYSFEYFLGGQMFPIDIMPAGIQAVMKWLPFYYELFCPIAIFMERLRGAELAQAFAIQTGWLLLTWAAAPCGNAASAITRPSADRRKLFRRRQPRRFPRFETARHRAHIFVAHLLQTLGRERGTTAAAAMANDECIYVRNFFFDV